MRTTRLLAAFSLLLIVGVAGVMLSGCGGSNRSCYNSCYTPCYMPSPEYTYYGPPCAPARTCYQPGYAPCGYRTGYYYSRY